MNKLAFFFFFCFFFFIPFNSVSGHFCVENRTSPSWMSPLPELTLLCFHSLVFLSGNYVLEDSENVCSDCRWCYCANINHKCKRRWGCVFVLSSPSPSPPLCRPPPLFPFPVFLTFPPLVVPVHSIRLDYGCVVVDTCSVWSVLSCYDLLLLVMPSNTEQWLDQWRQKMKGVTQVP